MTNEQKLQKLIEDRNAVSNNIFMDSIAGFEVYEPEIKELKMLEEEITKLKEKIKES